MPLSTALCGAMWLGAHFRTISTSSGAAKGPFTEAGQLVLLLARQEIDQAALHAFALEQRVVDLLGDRHFDPEIASELKRRADGVGTFGDAGERSLDIGPAPTFGQLDSKRV